MFQEAMEKDLMERASEPNLNLKAYLSDAYLHPIFHSFDGDEERGEVRVDRGQTRVPSPSRSEIRVDSPPHYVYHYEFES